MKKIKILAALTILATLGLSACSMLPSGGLNNNGNSGNNGNNGNGSGNNNNSSPRSDGDLTRAEIVSDINKITNFEKDHLSYFDIEMKEERKGENGETLASYISNGHLHFYNNNIISTDQTSINTDSNGEKQTYSSYSWLMMNSDFSKTAYIYISDGSESSHVNNTSTYDDATSSLLPGQMLKSAFLIEDAYQGEGSMELTLSEISVSGGVYKIVGKQTYKSGYATHITDFDISFKLNYDYSLQYLYIFGGVLGSNTDLKYSLEINYKFTNIKYETRSDAPSDMVTKLTNVLNTGGSQNPPNPNPNDENITEETLKNIILQAVNCEESGLYYASSSLRTYNMNSSGGVTSDRTYDMKIYAYQDNIYEVDCYEKSDHVSQMFYKANDQMYARYRYFNNLAEEKSVVMGYSSSFASFASNMYLPASYLTEILLFDDTRGHSDSDYVEFQYIKRSGDQILFGATYQTSTMEVIFTLNNDGSFSDLSIDYRGSEDAPTQYRMEYRVSVINYGPRDTAPEEVISIFNGF